MKDYKVVIDAGHGGTDPGASGNGIVEKDLTLLISKDMYEKFKKLGVPVTLTRTTDETLDPSVRVNRILNAYGNNSDVIVISNHINAGGGDGAEVIYALRNKSDLSNLILDNLQAQGQNVRKAYQRRLASDTSKDYYFIHRDTGITEPVIVEYGFLDSTLDDPTQLKNDYQKYVNAVVDAVAEYIGIKTENYYIVKSGDTLYKIATMYNTTVDEIKKLNNLTSNLLIIGQKLKVSTNDESSNIYIVKKGDNLYSIARNYNTTVDELKRLNNLTSDILNVGQKLILPIVEEETNDTYIVKGGDTLYKIAAMYNTTVSELMQLNNLSTNLLSIGQKLKIPSGDNITYVVQKGDSLYSIAKKYNTTVDSLKTKNNLPSNLLSIGQTLII